MAEEPKAPPVPADADLRDFQFMPIDIVRLFGSAFHARASDAEWRAGVTLWLKSYHQVPAGSLPDDDIELCRLAELGRDLKSWRKIKTRALHNWFVASDSRLYHPVVAEKVVEAWLRKGEQKIRTLKARIAALEKRFEAATNDQDKEHLSGLLTGLRQGLSQAITKPVTDPKPRPATATNRQGQGQGQGYEQGQGQGDSKGSTDPAQADLGLGGDADDLPLPINLDRSTAGDAVRIFNERAGLYHWPRVQLLTDKRRKHLNARLEEIGGIEGWKIALEMVTQSSFLMGKTPRGEAHANWKFNFDFLLRPDAMAKLMEGGYGDPTGAKRRTTSGSSISAAIAGIDEAGSG